MITAAQTIPRNRKTPALEAGAFQFNLVFHRALKQKVLTMAHYKPEPAKATPASNIVELFPTAPPQSAKNESRFETDFLKKSVLDGSPVEVVFHGELANRIRFVAMRYGKTPQQFTLDGFDAWLNLDGAA